MKLQRSIVNTFNFKKNKMIYLLILALISAYFSYNYLFKSETFTPEEEKKIEKVKLSASKLGAKMGSALLTSPIAPLISDSVKHVIQESQNDLQAFVKDVIEVGPAVIPILIETIIKPIIKIVKDALYLLKKDLIRDIKNNDTALAQAIEEKINGLSKSDVKNLVDVVVDSAADVDVEKIVDDVNVIPTDNERDDASKWARKWN